ncbi:MAG: MerR family DNA-binding transcriptional regulator, partial [Peptostreptococcaceae bacterium]
MENNKIKYFTTGELAKLYKINKKTLFHYDEIDLFKPEKVMSNGY